MYLVFSTSGPESDISCILISLQGKSQVIDLTGVTRDGSQLWGERYQQELADIFAIEEEMATEITRSLRIRLAGDEERRLTKRYTEDMEAYRDYLQGRFYVNQRTAMTL